MRSIMGLFFRGFFVLWVGSFGLTLTFGLWFMVETRQWWGGEGKGATKLIDYVKKNF